MTRRRTIKLSLFLGLPVLAIVLIVMFWSWDWLIPIADPRLSALIGRRVSIGHLHVSLGRVTQITADDVTIANPAGFPDDSHFVTADHLMLQVDVAQYIRDRSIVVPVIELDHPMVDAERKPDGDATWALKLPGGGSSAASSTPSKPPQIGELKIVDGQVHVLDPKLRTDFQLAVATQQDAQDKSGNPGRIVVDAKGTYAAQPITGRLIAGALLSIRDETKPYPVDLSLANGPTRVSLVGTIRQPLTFGGADLRLTFAGPDMSLLFPLTGVPIPKTPPYSIAGQLDYADRKIELRDFRGRVGQSDLEGTIGVDPTGAKPVVTADLASQRVDLADLAGFIGGTPGRTTTAGQTPAERAEVARANASGRLLPDTPISMPKLTAANVHLKYRGKRIEGRSIPLDNIVADLDIDDGRITLHPLSFAIGTGTLAGNIDLAPLRGNEFRAKADIRANQVDLSRLMAATHLFQGGGVISGSGEIDTTGNSLATLLANGNGGFRLGMNGGDLSALLVDLAGLQFGDAILSALGVPTRARLECFAADWALQNGTLNTRAFVIDTSEAVVRMKGDIDLRTERLNLTLGTTAKHFTIGSLPTPIDIEGTFKNPSIHPNYVALGVRGGLAVGLGVLFPPLAILPTIQFGDGRDMHCGEAATPAQATPERAAPQRTPARRAPVRR